MQINDANLTALFTGYNATFNKALASSQSHYKDVSMIVPSTTSDELYTWLAGVPRLREWIGDRIVNELMSHQYRVANKTYEATMVVPRTAIEDDRYGTYSPAIQQMAQNAATHPDELLFALLAQGFTTKCFDGQYFFDTDHPNSIDGKPGLPVSVSNVQAGSGAPWFLLDASQPIRPLLYQERIPPEFTYVTQGNDQDVFMRDRYTYGVRARGNVGFGLWQLAYASMQPLNSDNYAAARAAMMSQLSEEGRPLGIKPTHLVTLPALERDALRLLRSTIVDATTNEWADSATPIVTQYLLGGATAAQLALWTTVTAIPTS